VNEKLFFIFKKEQSLNVGFRVKTYKNFVLGELIPKMALLPPPLFWNPRGDDP